MRAAKLIIAELLQRDLLDLAEEIAGPYDVCVDDMCTQTSPRSTNDLELAARSARYAFWRELVENHGFSLPRVGELFGVHHTTVLYGVRIAHGLPGKNERKVA
jgi:chromosomal replication initiation ATPase DnaA